MAENKITLGQLVNVLTESGIDLNEIYLDENQINGMQTSLSEENQKKLVGFVSEIMKSVPDEELSQIGGGGDIKKTLINVGKGTAIAIPILAICATFVTELLERFGPEGAKQALKGRTPTALVGKAWEKIRPASQTSGTSNPTTI